MRLAVTKPVFNYLFQHMVEIHSKKMKIVNSFAIDFDEYMNMLSLIKTYINKCERFLGDVTIVREADEAYELPFVIFNSITHLSDEDGEEWSCIITLPKDDYEPPISNVDFIPCNTPEAYELILKQCGQSVVIEKDGKRKEYTVKGIEPNPLMPFEENER